jgi:hypothetical protein
MRALTRFFLKAKHWQLFGLGLLIVVFGEMLMGGVVMSLQRGESSAWVFASGIVMGVTLSSVMVWFWTVGSYLNSVAPEIVRPKMSFFRFSAIYPALYGFVAGSVFFGAPNGLWLLAIMPWHFLAMICVFYDLYFVAKNLAVAETGKRAEFYDFAGPFFLMWFYPIGVWFVQPRLNRLYQRARFASTEARDPSV